MLQYRFQNGSHPDFRYANWPRRVAGIPLGCRFPSQVKTNLPVSVFFKITENIFDVFHAVMKELKKNWIFQVGQYQLAQNRIEVIPIRFLLVLRNEGRENSDPQINQDRV